MHASSIVHASSFAIFRASLIHCGMVAFCGYRMNPAVLNAFARAARICRNSRVVGRGSCHTGLPNGRHICSAIALGHFLKFAAIIWFPLKSTLSLGSCRSPFLGKGAGGIGATPKRKRAIRPRVFAPPPSPPSRLIGALGGGAGPDGTFPLVGHVAANRMTSSAATGVGFVA